MIPLIRLGLLGSCFFSLLSCDCQEGARKAPLLFEDPMTSNWRDNWFVDGKEVTLEHRDGGLFFSAGTVTKAMDPEEYHAHHAVLWTKSEFEGDLRITYEMTRVDQSGYGTTLLYLQAQGTGRGPYAKDISEWNKLREIPAMNLYFENMDLISLSFRENLRCKRYPLRRPDGERYSGKGFIDPMVDYEQLKARGTYLFEVEKRAKSVALKMVEKKTKKVILDHTWNTTLIPEELGLREVTKGRIGLRHMSTRQFVYRDFRIERL